MRVMFGIPSLDAKVEVKTVQSLLAETEILDDMGHETSVSFVTGCSLITHARNDLCTTFLRSGFDKLMFIDADVSWEPGAVMRLVHHAHDVVGGAYPYKRGEEGYPVTWLGSRERVGGLIEVDALPGGFLCVSRPALETIAVAHPERRYAFGQDQHFAFFDAPFQNGRLYGEDNAFCALWRSIGGKVWIDPDLTLTHTGGNPSYTGRIGDWLAREAALSIAAE